MCGSYLSISWYAHESLEFRWNMIGIPWISLKFHFQSRRSMKHEGVERKVVGYPQGSRLIVVCSWMSWAYMELGRNILDILQCSFPCFFRGISWESFFSLARSMKPMRVTVLSASSQVE